MRLMLTAMNCPKGRLAANRDRHREMLQHGAEANCDLVLFPEMSLTGYRASAALTLDDPDVQSLVRATSQAPALCFGVAERAAAGPPYITQILAANGNVVAVHRKAHLGEGEECDFQPGPPASAFEIAGTPCVIAICAEIGNETAYAADVRLVLGPSAPGLYGERRRTDEDWRRGFDWWRDSVRQDAERFLRDDQLLAVSTQAGPTDDEDFPGWAALIEQGGRPVEELPNWRESRLVVDLDG